MPDMNMPDMGMPDMSMPDICATFRRLGPARVTLVAGTEVEVAIADRRVLATMAVTGFYTPVVGDIVLVIETDASAYVIGVLHATGPMVITAPGDLHLRAARGCIALDAKVVRAAGVEIRLEATTMSLTAERLRERFGEVRRVISEALELDVGEVRARVRGLFALASRRIRATAEADVKIDGQQIHLG
jgi:hypothetical protein